MHRLNLIAPLLAVTVVAACGQDPAAADQRAGDAPGAAAAQADGDAPTPLDDEEVVRRVFLAAADGDDGALPEQLTPRISAVRVGVVALHDQLLDRRRPTPPRAALLDALDALADRAGGVDAGALAPLVAAWRDWSDDQVATETELARLLSIANAAFALDRLPGADGLADIGARADEFGAPPLGSGAGAGIAFVRYAALAVGEEGADVTTAQTAALSKAREAFEELGWPGGLALMAEPLANALLAKDPAGMRGAILWSTAADAYRASGDLLRSGMMYVRRAGRMWRGQLDADAARRAALMAETGRARVAESGAGGRELFEACYVHAALLQAVGRHEKAITAARAALAVGGAGGGQGGDAAERADAARIEALSNLRLGRFDECLAVAARALDAAAAAEGELPGEKQMIVPALEEIAGHACLRLGRYDDAARWFAAVAAFHEREAGKPWASAEQRDAARLAGARALAKSGDPAGARAAVGEVLASGPKGAAQLALAADVLLDAGFTDDADEIVAEGEQALGAERAALFGELRWRIAAARGDLDAARTAFRGAIDFVTGGDTTKKSLSASRIFESWARVEEAASDPVRAAELFQTAANHLVDIGVDHELRRLLAEVKRLRD